MPELFDDKKIKVVTAYGIDNLPAYFLGMDVITKKIGYEYIVDVNIINEFLLLNGNKFSTSRNHALWVRKLIEENIINSDILRLALALYCPNGKPQDFNTAEITRNVNDFIRGWNGFITRVFTVQEKN